ncbi:MAG TPA: PQQ-binding-like beta-propeller repeat protein [Gemmataceae bacterium]|nr:PQQ-binding-like beta-propeller repeat protein [Gemmataceae bacterium]
MRGQIAIALFLALCPFAAADDWPQWLGPTRDGSVPEKVAPWKGNLKELWRVPVAGEGESSPVVAAGRVYVHSKVADKDAELIQAFDVKTGKVKWEQAYAKTPFKPFFGQGPRATPCVHDGMVYTLGNTGVLACWDAASGKQVWKIETLADPKKDNLLFGLSSSPLIVGDNVIVQGGGAGSRGLKAYDRKTGKPAWTAGDDPASYASPVFIDGQVVALTGAHLMAVSPAGEVKWKFPFKDALNESSITPIKVGDLYIASSVTAGSVAVKVTDKGGKAEAASAWKNPRLTCYFSTPMPVGKDHLYMVTGTAFTKTPTVTLRCVETATGKEVWNKPKVGKYHAAVYRLADGNLLMHDDDTGDLRLLAPNVKEYEELAKSKACGPTWAHPAIANGVIYVRDTKELVALSLPGE